MPSTPIYSIHFEDLDKVNGYLLAGLELQRAIRFSYQVFFKLSDMHSMTLKLFSNNKSYYKKEANVIKRIMTNSKKPYSYTPDMETLTSWIFDNNLEVRNMIEDEKMKLICYTLIDN